MAKYQIYLVRHGKTWFNQYNKMQGWSDTPLTPEGLEAAKVTADALKDVPFNDAFSSDARRAIDTCKLIVDKNVNKDNLNPKKLMEFREQFYGYFEGMDSEMAWRMIGGSHGYGTRQEMFAHESIDTIKDWIKEADPYHQAENAEEYWARLDDGFKLISQLDGAENILLVTHGFTIRSLWYRYGDHIPLVPGPKNASITIMTMSEKGEIKIPKWNLMHL